MTEAQTLGQLAEDRAAQHLQKAGLHLLKQNYRTRFGEIDLILEDQATLVFVEVRFRKYAHFGNSLESVTPQKQEKITRTAHHYLLAHQRNADAFRFDVIALDGQHPNTAKLTWLQHAF